MSVRVDKYRIESIRTAEQRDDFILWLSDRVKEISLTRSDSQRIKSSRCSAVRIDSMRYLSTRTLIPRPLRFLLNYSAAFLIRRRLLSPRCPAAS